MVVAGPKAAKAGGLSKASTLPDSEIMAKSTSTSSK
jgi:hypothetical protein